MKELELGLDTAFLKRFTLDFTYARAKVEDQISAVPLPSFGGFVNKWQNTGALKSNTFEATLNAAILRSRQVHWTAGINFDRTRGRITRLEVPPYYQAPFFIQQDEELDAIYGGKFIRNPDELPAGISREQFNVNDDGYVVWVGDGNTFRDGMAKTLGAQPQR